MKLKDCPFWDQYVRLRSIDRKSAAAIELRNRIILHYASIATIYADRIKRTVPNGSVDRDDLESEGKIGLIQAVETFEPARGFKFESFATRRVIGAIVDHLRDIDHISRCARGRSKKLERARDQLRSKTGREPSLQESMTAAGLDEVPQAPEVTEFSSYIRQVSRELDRTGDGSRVGSNRTICENFDKAAAQSSQAESRDFIEWALGGLSNRSRLLVELHCVHGFSMREAGLVVGITESRVSQIISELMPQLQRRLLSLN
jgi:RNA polymerase sigma factor for flagellar operon FliA